MSTVNFYNLQKQQIQELLDLVQVDGLPENPAERLATLQLLAKSDTWIPDFCPETGISLEGIDPIKHAAALWPDCVVASKMSPEAREREAALYRAANRPAPMRRGN